MSTIAAILALASLGVAALALRYSNEATRLANKAAMLADKAWGRNDRLDSERATVIISSDGECYSVEPDDEAFRLDRLN